MSETPTTVELLQWPTSSEAMDAVTADWLAQYYAQSFQLFNGMVWDGRAIDKPLDHARAVQRQVDAFAIVMLLRELPKDRADEIARNLVGIINDGGSCGEFIWEWLTDWAMDPTALAAEGGRLYLAKSADVQS